MLTEVSRADDCRWLPTIVDTLRARAAATPQNTLYHFLIDGERENDSLTYEQLDIRARTIAAELQRHSQPGDRILLLFAPGLEYVAAFFGCLYSGRIAVPAYPPDERTTDHNLDRLRGIADDCAPRVFLTRSGTPSRIRTAIAGNSDVQWLATDEIDVSGGMRWHTPDLTGQSLAFLQYTSGSTARPRGVRITFDNLRANLAAIFDRFGHVTGETRGAIWLPPYHDMGLIGGILQPAWGGFAVTLMAPQAFLRRPARWLELISRDRCQVAGGPNFAYDYCAQRITHEEKSGLDLSSWKVAFNGAEPVRAGTLDRFAAAFAGCGFSRRAFYPCYGLAEATLMVAGPAAAGDPVIDLVDAEAIRNGQRRPATGAAARSVVSCGTAALGEIVIVEPSSGQLLADDVIGEIWVRGEHVAAGYWRSDDETRQIFEARLAPSGDGPFLRTGDLGYLHARQLHVTGRLKDLIIVAGRNHYAHDLELTVESCHPALRPGSCVVFSIGDEDQRVVVVAEIRATRQSEATTSALAHEIAERVRAAVSLEHQVRVDTIHFVPPGTVPKTSSGKLQRSICRAQLLDGALPTLWIDALDSDGGRPPTGAIAAELLEKLGHRLGVSPSALNPTTPLISYGLDSLAVMELKGHIQEHYGVDVPLGVLLDGATISSLEQLLASSTPQSARASAVAEFPESAAKAPSTSFSLFFFASDPAQGDRDDIYRLLHESARFADAHGFEAIWTPERHFHEFGGPFPNPAVLGAALATMTRTIHIRAGSVLAPLSAPVRIAEDWAVVDNLSRGRVGVAFAAGWNPNDFVISPAAFAARHQNFEQTIETVRRLWRGEAVSLPNGEGRVIDVRALPLPRQREIPIWITAVKNRATFELAGRLGANILTNLLLSSDEELSTNLTHYRRARAAAGFNPDEGRVTLMLHTFVGDTDAEARAIVEQPLRRYIEASVELWSDGVEGLSRLDPQHRRRMIDSALERHYANGLFGSPAHCREVVARLRVAGVTEVACLIDFGIPAETVLRSLPKLNALKESLGDRSHPIAAALEPPAPLTFAQERMWFLQQLEPQNPGYNDLLALRCEGPLDADRLRRALDDVVRRHEVLRTTFPALDGTPVQRVLEAGPIAVDRIDLRSLPARQWDEELRVIAGQHARVPFDLATSPPLRAALIQLSDVEHVLVLVIHHIATDAVSARNICRELTAGYEASASGNAAGLPSRPLQQREIARRAREHKDEHAEGVRWWAQRLSSSLPLELCADRSRPSLSSGRGIRCPVLLDHTITAALRSLATQESVTPFMLLLSIFGVILRRYSQQDRFAVGTPFEGREQPGTADAVGSFVNTLALPLNLSGTPSFRAVLRDVKSTALEAYAHASVPFGLVVEAVAPQRALGRTPIFQAMFSLQRTLPAPIDQGDVRWTPIEFDPGTSKFDLRLELTDQGDLFQGYIEASADLFVEGTVRRITKHFQNAATRLIAAPDASIDDVDLSDAEERAAVERALRGEIRQYDLERTLDALLRTQSSMTPEQVALEWSNGSFTYRELVQRVDAWAGRLVRLGVRPNDVVAVVAPRSPELVVGLLAALRAGAAFLLVDPSQPGERLTFLLDDAAPAIVLAQPAFVGQLTRPGVVPLQLEIGEDAASEFPQTKRTPDDIAYVMYTSGSTGRPKGVLVRHRSAINRVAWSQEKLPLQASDAVLLKSAISFDVFVWETFAPLLAGARLVVADDGVERDPVALIEVMKQHRVTVAHFVPSMLNALLAHDQVGTLPLRRAHCSGEVLPVDLQARFFERLPGVQLVNLYGPTEAAVDVTWWVCHHEREARSVPIGSPAPNVRLHLLDEKRRSVPAGLPGEIFIAGVQVAAGYLNRPESEAAAFIDDPDAGRQYRTGDLARLMPTGSLEYLGRRDQQVKVRGFRIELGEIESVLREHADVEDVAVALRDLPRGEKGLVAYIVSRRGTCSPEVLRAFLASRLPREMVPAAYVAIDELPRTTSGKVDRRGLPPPPDYPRNHDVRFEADTLVREVALLLGEVLGLKHVGSDDGFFDLGGHSLLAADLIARIRRVFGVDFTLRALFVDSTPRGIATSIARLGAGERLEPEAGLALSREELVREAQLEPTFVARRRDRRSTGGDILLTGATGFVGAFLLRELIDNTTARIHCLVRASSPARAFERIRTNLIANGIWDELKMAGRIRAVPGDLSRHKLGLDADDYDRLVQNVTSVFHNGALVDHARLYRALRAPNVSGTKELLELSNLGGASFHYISTLSVFESPGYEGVASVDESDEPSDPLCHDSYAQSKWVAERLVHEAGHRGMSVTIHRLAMCTGDSKTGRGGGLGLFSRFLAGVISLRAAPQLQLDTWLTPVDFVARGVCHLAIGHRDPGARTFHLGCREPVPYEWLVEALNRIGCPVALAPFEQWRGDAMERSTPDDALYAILPFVTDDLQTRYGRGHRPRLDSEMTASALAAAAIVCPPFTEDLLARYVEHWKETGLVRRI